MPTAEPFSAERLNNDGVIKLLHAVELQAARDYLEEARSGDMCPELETNTIRPYTDSWLFFLSPKGRDEFFKLLNQAAARKPDTFRYRGRKPNPVRLTREDLEEIVRQHDGGNTYQQIADRRGVSIRTLLRDMARARKLYELPDPPRHNAGRKKRKETCV